MDHREKSTRRQKLLQRRLWITKAIIISMKRKQRMHKTPILSVLHWESTLCKESSNLLTRVKKLAKKIYFYCNIEEHKNDPKKAWDVLHSLLPNKRVSYVPNFIIVGDKNISDPNIMVDKFNIHFANVGEVQSSRHNYTDNNAFFFISQIDLTIFCLPLYHTLPYHTLLNLYFALVHSHLLY